MVKPSHIWWTRASGVPAGRSRGIVRRVLLATKAVVERDLAQGFITEQRLRFTIEARRKEHKALADNGASVREIAKLTGMSKSQVANDIKAARPENGQNLSINGTRTTRELLSQSDQNDWRTPRKFLDAAREVMGAIDLDPASSAEANGTVGAGRALRPRRR
jgi:predicted transcriptional regulator